MPARDRNRPRRRFAPMLAALLFFLAVPLSGCVPDAAEPGPSVTVPKLKEDALIARDGRALPLRAWLPEGRPKALVLAVHGFGGFGLVFEELGVWLREAGYGLYAIDQRGFGDNPERGGWAGGKVLIADVQDFVRAARGVSSDVPLFVLGVSMGGAAVLAAKPEGVAGLILAAPAARSPGARKPVQDGLLAVGATLAPRIGFEITHDDPRLTAEANGLYREDPRIVRRMTVAQYHGILGLADRAFAAAGEIDLPVLLFYGTADPVLPPAAACGLIDRIKAPLKVRILRDGLHNVLNQAGLDTATPILSFLADPRAPLPPDPAAVAIETLCAPQS